jgi:hypothetical protein
MPVEVTTFPHFNQSSWPAHIVMAVYEGWTTGFSGTYTNTLIAAGCNFTNYSDMATGGLSEPTYIAFSSCGTQGMTTDSCPQTSGAENLWHEMQAAGKTLVGYFEDLPSVGSAACTNLSYVRRHNPFIQFTNITDQSINVPFTGGGSWPGWNAAASDYSSLPLFTFVKASVAHDGHPGDSTMATADTWVHDNLDNYVQWAKTHNSLFILIADDNGGSGLTFCCIAGARVNAGTTNSQVSDHSGLANTLAGLRGVAPFAGAAATLTGWYT